MPDNVMLSMVYAILRTLKNKVTEMECRSVIARGGIYQVMILVILSSFMIKSHQNDNKEIKFHNEWKARSKIHKTEELEPQDEQTHSGESRS